MFFDTLQLREIFSPKQMKSLLCLKDIAKQYNLSGKHIYKDFRGIFAAGNLDLLKSPIIAIIGTRSPNQYSKHYTAMLSRKLSKKGFVIISGGAIGTDCIAHQNSDRNSILVSPVGLNQIYPKQNKNLFEKIRSSGLLLSEYEDNEMPRAHQFLERNRIIIALSDVVIIPQADLQSGSSSSARLCVALDKPLFTLPHRMNESLGTQELLHSRKANAIYNLEFFVNHIYQEYNPNKKDEIREDNPKVDMLLEFAGNNGLFLEALQRFGDIVFEYELQGKIRRNGLHIELV